MYSFHISIHGEGGGLLQKSFDDSAAALRQLPRLYFEPDGSFVWAGQSDGQAWQVFGQLQDGGPSLAHVELNGRCPEPRFDELLACFGWPEAVIAFQHVERGTWQSEAEFRQDATG